MGSLVANHPEDEKHKKKKELFPCIYDAVCEAARTVNDGAEPDESSRHRCPRRAETLAGNQLSNKTSLMSWLVDPGWHRGRCSRYERQSHQNGKLEFGGSV